MKRSKLFRKKLLPLFLSVAVAGSQVPVMAADFGDTAVVSADADETERSQSIRNQGQTGESSEAGEYSRAMKSHFRKFGNQMSGSGNHLCNYASLLA